MTCVAECPTYPQYLYAWATNSSNAECVSSCSTGYMNEANMSCVAKCPILLDPTTNKCVAQCPYNSVSNTILYADLTSSKCVTADLCPNNTFASDDLLTCVSSCPNDTYIYQKYCVSMCPDGLYINTASRYCVAAKDCPNNTFGNNQTRTCSSSCTNGTYADSTTKMCITQCYGFNYADPVIKVCSSNCSSGLVKNDITLSCVGSCSSGYFFNPSTSNCSTTCQSPYFADTTKAACVLTCSSDPMTFSSTSP
jgi:proprotein convertase subtilisin/kexin type 5